MEQKKRIEFRKKSTNKFWKYSQEDDTAAKQFDQYRAGYDEVFMHCKTEKWSVIPADKCGTGITLKQNFWLSILNP